jgi:hypothetical protein
MHLKRPRLVDWRKQKGDKEAIFVELLGVNTLRKKCCTRIAARDG